MTKRRQTGNSGRKDSSRAAETDRFTDPERDEGEQQRWLDSITEWAEADLWQDIQVTETFAALADMKTGTGPGGDRATVEMWQNLPVQLMLKVSISTGTLQSPSMWTSLTPQQAGADDFDVHRYLSLLATMGKWIARILVERMRQSLDLICQDGSTRLVSHKVGRRAQWLALSG